MVELRERADVEDQADARSAVRPVLELDTAGTLLIVLLVIEAALGREIAALEAVDQPVFISEILARRGLEASR